MAQQALVSQGLLITEASRSQSAGLLWACDQLDKDLHLTAQQSQETFIHAPGGIRTRNPSKRAAADPRLRPGGHWDLLCVCVCVCVYVYVSPSHRQQRPLGRGEL